MNTLIPLLFLFLGAAILVDHWIATVSFVIAAFLALLIAFKIGEQNMKKHIAGEPIKPFPETEKWINSIDEQIDTYIEDDEDEELIYFLQQLHDVAGDSDTVKLHIHTDNCKEIH